MDPLRTHLYPFHKNHGKLVEFAGFEMPIWYEGVVPEHMAVRNSAGIFDVTHMGRSLFTGPDAGKLLDYLTTRVVSSLNLDQVHYSTMCNEAGGIKDDLTVYRIAEHEFLMVYNAGNRKSDYEWIVENSKGFNAKIEDVSDEIPMFAFQGPKAQEILQSLTEDDLGEIRRFRFGWVDLMGVKTLVARTGYTGEDGFEIMPWNILLSKPSKAIELWERILAEGKSSGVEPCGLGARDTLRLEAGMCLYGSDITEEITPFEARLDFVVQLESGNFIGREALARQKKEGVKRVRVGMRMIDRGIPRPGFTIMDGETGIGKVTSGTQSPILQKGIAIAYIPVEYFEVGRTLSIRVRGRDLKAEIVDLPFFNIDKYGWRRKKE